MTKHICASSELLFSHTPSPWAAGSRIVDGRLRHAGPCTCQAAAHAQQFHRRRPQRGGAVHCLKTALCGQVGALLPWPSVQKDSRGPMDSVPGLEWCQGPVKNGASPGIIEATLLSLARQMLHCGHAGLMGLLSFAAGHQGGLPHQARRPGQGEQHTFILPRTVFLLKALLPTHFDLLRKCFYFESSFYDA